MLPSSYVLLTLIVNDEIFLLQGAQRSFAIFDKVEFEQIWGLNGIATLPQHGQKS